MIQPKTKLILRNEEDFFGPGTAELFRKTQEYGSIRMAAESMHMSYSKAQKLIIRAEKESEFPILIRKAGGKNGGYSELTAEGKEFLRHYYVMRKEVQAATDAIFKKHFSDNTESKII
ncbi:MAG: LysR family transcriptional regulator [Clostridiales bacterium]|nr:LysR family transcriptional regulator [Clostridiales bacterium]